MSSLRAALGTSPGVACPLTMTLPPYTSCDWRPGRQILDHNAASDGRPRQRHSDPHPAIPIDAARCVTQLRGGFAVSGRQTHVADAADAVPRSLELRSRRTLAGNARHAGTRTRRTPLPVPPPSSLTPATSVCTGQFLLHRVSLFREPNLFQEVREVQGVPGKHTGAPLIHEHLRGLRHPMAKPILRPS